MYGTKLATAAAGPTALALTGFETAWAVLGALTVIGVGVALKTLLPRRQS